MKTDLESEAVEFMSRVFKTYGLGDLQATLIATLYIEPCEMAMEDLAAKTGYSLASVSNTMRFLEAVGVAQRNKRPGSKKVYFYIEKDLAKLNVLKLQAAINNFINPAKEFLPEFIEKHRDKVGDEDKEKLEVIENYLAQLIEFEKLACKWLCDLEDMSDRLSFTQTKTY